MAVIRWRPFGQALERWDSTREMSDLQQEVNRLFDSFFGRGGMSAGPERVWAPALDMYETKDELVITAELAGVSEKEIQLSITGDVLTLRGERTQSSETTEPTHYRSERWFGKFERSVPLPIPVQSDKVKATYRDGVLTVKLPKAEEIKSKEIKIDVA
jgi:HSP20 family protein